MQRRIILNADDFGLSFNHNKAVLDGYKTGFLTSASLCANTEAFNNAIEILRQCPNLGLGAHLNIQEGKSLTNCPLLTDKNGYFNKSYLYLILNQNNKNLQAQIEQEFRAQIEKILKYSKIDHLDSHVHTHAIPGIFKITAKLASYYNIEFIRTQIEKPYIIPNQKINFNYLTNLIKIALLGYYTNKNKKVLKKYNLKTNDFILGVGYTGMMNASAIKYGLNKLKEKLKENKIVEALIHPCKYEVLKDDSHNKEFELTQDLKLKKIISKLGFLLSSYKA